MRENEYELFLSTNNLLLVGLSNVVLNFREKNANSISKFMILLKWLSGIIFLAMFTFMRLGSSGACLHVWCSNIFTIGRASFKKKKNMKYIHKETLKNAWCLLALSKKNVLKMCCCKCNCTRNKEELYTTVKLEVMSKT